MSRKRIVAGNWKMNMTPAETVGFISKLKPLVEDAEADVVVCVPAIDIVTAITATRGTNIMIGAQNMHFEESGAYTGEISPAMLESAGVKFVILGHSERREYNNETDAEINKKVIKAFEHGITPILCCGETLKQRELDLTEDFIRMQIKSALAGVSKIDVQNMIIAYEPIWAIGTGETASSEQAEEVCKTIRKCIEEMYDENTSDAVRILYGGSVNASNAAELFSQPDIDGGLVGGASLKPDFGKIVNA
ncbi:triose-phosphate isomerase [Butyrivibrio sp. LC3010]|uniref:triose-phosphate isomerase n=1 Tax=Butyrivibrio sp. LC3010 TaxID=1280680 RepID=UPI0004283972|nr:triose-phosphate isomerase [Butyrivibrio sp. LC3010]